MSKETPKKDTGTCITYIGLGYNHNDKTGDGYCADMFTSGGKLKRCKAVIAERKCPYGRTSPFSDEPAEVKTNVA